MTTKTFADSNFGSHAVKLIIHVTWLEVGVNAKGSRVTVLTANNMMHENSVSNPNNVRGWLLLQALWYCNLLNICINVSANNFITLKLAKWRSSNLVWKWCRLCWLPMGNRPWCYQWHQPTPSEVRWSSKMPIAIWLTNWSSVGYRRMKDLEILQILWEEQRF